MQPKLIFLIGAVLIVVSWIILTKHQPSLGINSALKADYVVNLESDGFHPSNLTIKKGQVIKFVTNTGQFFWPASDPHPTHDLYPEFDPKQPIDPQSSWSFQFNQVGQWHFHDHLTPYNTGTMTVKG